MHDLTWFQRDPLYVIAGMGVIKGPVIEAEPEGYYEDEANHGRSYPTLDALVGTGLVEKGSIDDRTNSYSITSRGRRELDARREWEVRYVGA